MQRQKMEPIKKPPATLPKPKKLTLSSTSDVTSVSALRSRDDVNRNTSYLFSPREEKRRSRDMEALGEELKYASQTLPKSFASQRQASQLVAMCRDHKTPLRPPKRPPLRPGLVSPGGPSDDPVCIRDSPGRDSGYLDKEPGSRTDSGIASSSPTPLLTSEEGNTTFVSHIKQLDDLENIEPQTPTVKILSPVFCQTLWVDLPQVQSHPLCAKLTKTQRTLYEAKYEIISTEGTFNGSMHVYNNVFVASKRLHDLLATDDYNTLFSRVKGVLQCSDKVLANFTRCLERDIFMEDIMDVVLRHIDDIERVFVEYCTHQNEMQEMYLQLLFEKSAFKSELSALLLNPACKHLSFDTFIISPMQRITRLPLLVEKLLKSFSSESHERDKCSLILNKLRKIVEDCNEGTNTVDQERAMKKWSRQLVFPPDFPISSIASKTRHVVLAGEFTRHTWVGDDAKLSHTKAAIHLILFSDILFLAKKRGGSYHVVDFCWRHLVVMSTLNGVGFLPSPITTDAPDRAMIFLTLVRNYRNEEEQMVLSVTSERDRSAWLRATRGYLESKEDSLEVWDSIDVTASRIFKPSEPSYLELSVGDRVQVLRIAEYDWYYGVRKTDGDRGLFPASHVLPDCRAHTRARTLKKLFYTLSENNT